MPPSASRSPIEKPPSCRPLRVRIGTLPPEGAKAYRSARHNGGIQRRVRPMHPALSVILFTTLSGAGYGVLMLVGLHVALAPAASAQRPVAVAAMLLALVMAAGGLLASFWHLGHPERAWRAFSQWRSSWLSREAVAAALSFVPALALAWLLWQGGDARALRAA